MLLDLKGLFSFQENPNMLISTHEWGKHRLCILIVSRKYNKDIKKMIKTQTIYNYAILAFMICFLFAGLGFFLAYIGYGKLGYKIGLAGAVIGNVIVWGTLAIRFISKFEGKDRSDNEQNG